MLSQHLILDLSVDVALLQSEYLLLEAVDLGLVVILPVKCFPVIQFPLLAGISRQKRSCSASRYYNK